MEKNTVWAIGLSTVVLVGFFAAQTFLFPPQKNQAQNEEQKTEVASSENPENASEVQNQAVGSDSTINTVESESIVAVADKSASGESSENLTEEKFTITTNKVAVTFTNRGGDIVSYELIEKDDRGTLKNRDADTGKGVDLI